MVAALQAAGYDLQKAALGLTLAVAVDLLGQPSETLFLYVTLSDSARGCRSAAIYQKKRGPNVPHATVRVGMV
jgi:hypothetical protein